MIRIRYTVNVDFTPDGTGPMTNDIGAQTIQFTQTAPILVGGANNPGINNFNTALVNNTTTPAAGCAMADISAQILAVLPRIQGWATGGG